MVLDIEVLWHTSETRRLSDAGMDYSIDDVEWKTITFYSIDVIAPNKWDDTHEFCDIHAGGEKWITPYTYEEVKSLIEAARRLAGET